jgi:hypothetical protein
VSTAVLQDQWSSTAQEAFSDFGRLLPESANLGLPFHFPLLLPPCAIVFLTWILFIRPRALACWPTETRSLLVETEGWWMRDIGGINGIIRRCFWEMGWLFRHHCTICEGCISVWGWLNVLAVLQMNTYPYIVFKNYFYHLYHAAWSYKLFFNFLCPTTVSVLWRTCMYHHRHKHQGLDPLIRSVSRVIVALSNIF